MIIIITTIIKMTMIIIIILIIMTLIIIIKIMIITINNDICHLYSASPSLTMLKLKVVLKSTYDIQEKSANNIKNLKKLQAYHVNL